MKKKSKEREKILIESEKRLINRNVALMQDNYYLKNYETENILKVMVPTP